MNVIVENRNNDFFLQTEATCEVSTTKTCKSKEMQSIICRTSQHIKG